MSLSNTLTERTYAWLPPPSVCGVPWKPLSIDIVTYVMRRARRLLQNYLTKRKKNHKFLWRECFPFLLSVDNPKQTQKTITITYYYLDETAEFATANV